MTKRNSIFNVKRYQTAKLDILPKMVQIMRSRGKKNNVIVRCVFIKISHVDTVNERYYADVFLEAKWSDPSLENGKNEENEEDFSKYWNPRMYIENCFGEIKETISREIVFYSEEPTKGFIIEKHRIKAMFHETLELRQFPFDCQDLSIILTSELSYDELEFSESSTELSRINEHAEVDSQEWDLHKHVEVSITDILSDCNVGPVKRPSIKFTCRVSRRFGYFIINNFLISILLCLLAFSSLAVSPQNTFGRLQLCMIILLTTVTFKVAVSQNLPKISYLTYLDKAILGNIVIIICLCIWHAVISHMFEDAIFQNSTATELSNTRQQILNLRHQENILLITFILGYSFVVLLFILVIYFDAGARRKKMHLKDKQFMKKLEQLYDDQKHQPISSSLIPFFASKTV